MIKYLVYIIFYYFLFSSSVNSDEIIIEDPIQSLNDIIDEVDKASDVVILLFMMCGYCRLIKFLESLFQWYTAISSSR